MEPNTHNIDTESRAEGSPDPSVLGGQLLGLTNALSDFFAAVEPAAMSGEDLTKQVLLYLDGVREPIQQGDEKAFFTRRAGMFIAECMSSALRRNLRGDEVPYEQAAVLDALYQKIQSVKTGISGETPNVDQLENMADTAQAQMRSFMAQAGLIKKVPNEAPDRSIVLSG